MKATRAPLRNRSAERLVEIFWSRTVLRCVETMPSVVVPLLLTLKVASLATAVACTLGIAAGYALAQSRMPGRDTADALLLLPLVLPPTVLGYYLLVAFGRSSPFGAWLEDALGIHLIFTWQGAAVAAAVVAFPLIFKASHAAFEAVDPTL